jgi:hypothetical protein
MWNENQFEGASPCDFCYIPESECPCSLKYSTEVEEDRNKFNKYAEIYGGIIILPPEYLT